MKKILLGSLLFLGTGAGELDGTQKEFAETGEPTRVTIYENGFQKEEKALYLNGQTRSQAVREKHGEKIVSHQKEFWDSGKLQREWTTEDERLVGKQQAFREDGSVAFEENYAEGKRQGLAKYYHDDGKQIAREVAYVGDVVKHVKEWDDKGKLLADDEYLADGSKKRFLKH